MAAYQKFSAFVEHLAEKVHKLDTDTLVDLICSSLSCVQNARGPMYWMDVIGT